MTDKEFKKKKKNVKSKNEGKTLLTFDGVAVN